MLQVSDHFKPQWLKTLTGIHSFATLRFGRARRAVCPCRWHSSALAKTVHTRPGSWCRLRAGGLTLALQASPAAAWAFSCPAASPSARRGVCIPAEPAPSAPCRRPGSGSQGRVLVLESQLELPTSGRLPALLPSAVAKSPGTTVPRLTARRQNSGRDDEDPSSMRHSTQLLAFPRYVLQSSKTSETQIAAIRKRNKAS